MYIIYIVIIYIYIYFIFFKCTIYYIYVLGDLIYDIHLDFCSRDSVVTLRFNYHYGNLVVFYITITHTDHMK